MQIQENPTEAACENLVTFVIGPYRLCGPLLPVRRIITPPALTRLPLSKPTAAGVFRFEKRVALAFDLRHAFGLASRRDSGDGLLIVTEISPGTVAFWIDEVLDVSPSAAFSWRTTPSALTDGIAERYASAGDAVFLYATYERLFRAETLALTEAARIAAPVPASPIPNPAASANVETQQPAAPAIALPVIEPAANSETVAPVSLRPPARTHAPALTSAAATYSARPPSVSPVRQIRPTATQVVQPLRREGVAETTRAQTFVSTQTTAAITHAPVAIVNAPVAPGRNHLRLRIAAIVMLVPLLGTLAYWIWPSERATLHEYRQQPVLAASASVAPAPASLSPQPEPARPTGGEHKLEVATGEYVITIESPARQAAPERVVADAPPAKNQWEQITHRVRRGDTLWAISQRYLGNPFLYPELARLSTITNPHLIHPGDVVRIRRATRSPSDRFGTAARS